MTTSSHLHGNQLNFTTGPAVIVSYVIAGIASLISALTYCELAGRFQGVGSAYLYVYYVLGELAASVIGE